MLTVVLTYRILTLRRGTANTWIDYCQPAKTREEMLRRVDEAVEYGYTVKIKRVAVVQPPCT